VERKLDANDKLLVLGSDGIWDQVSSAEAVAIASRHKDPKKAAREIAGVARQRWEDNTQGQLSDDITAVVVRLESPLVERARHLPGTRAASAGVLQRATSRGVLDTPPTISSQRLLLEPLREQPRAASAASLGGLSPVKARRVGRGLGIIAPQVAAKPFANDANGSLSPLPFGASRQRQRF